MNVGKFRILECYRSALSDTIATRHMGLFKFKLKLNRKLSFSCVCIWVSAIIEFLHYLQKALLDNGILVHSYS